MPESGCCPLRQLSMQGEREFAFFVSMCARTVVFGGVVCGN